MKNLYFISVLVFSVAFLYKCSSVEDQDISSYSSVSPKSSNIWVYVWKGDNSYPGYLGQTFTMDANGNFDIESKDGKKTSYTFMRNYGNSLIYHVIYFPESGISGAKLFVKIKQDHDKIYISQYQDESQGQIEEKEATELFAEKK